MRKELSRRTILLIRKEMLEYRTFLSILEDSTLNTNTRKLKYTVIVIKKKLVSFFFLAEY